MSSYSADDQQARHPFIVVPYTHGQTGALRPRQLPSRGFCEQPGGTPCRVGVKDRRERKTGPGFPLTVAHCAVHGQSFTLYPPGHVPYGRRGVAPVAADGSDVHVVAEPLPASTATTENGQQDNEQQRWQGTLLEAAFDADRGHAWARQPEQRSCSPHWWSQQGRLLEVGQRLLGICPAQPAELREVAARALMVDLLELREQAAQLGAGAGYRRRGRAIVAVLSRLWATGAVTLERVLCAGYVAGLWGAPWRWDPKARVLRPPAFHPPSTGPP